MTDEVLEMRISDIKYKLAVKLSEFRKKNGLNQTQMAALVKSNQGNYSRIENGKLSNISIDQLIRMNYLAKTGLKLITLAQ